MSIDLIWKEFEENRQTVEKCENIEFFCDCSKNNQVQMVTTINNVMLCEYCGIVFQDRIISDEAEWRTFGNDEGGGYNDSGNRCGQVSDPLAPTHSMSTFISGNSNMAKRNLWISLPYEEKVLFDLKKKLTCMLIIADFLTI